MPFTTMFTLTSDRLGPVGAEKKLYNFFFPVSTFGGGERVDVMLLQALFRMFYYEFIGFGSIDPPGGSNGVIVVDGIVGPQTRMHIHHFQQHMLTRGVTRTTDGVIDPVKKQGVRTPRTHVRYQLEVLNAECLRLAFDNNVEGVHQNMIDLEFHPEEVYPPELRSALRITQVML